MSRLLRIPKIELCPTDPLRYYAYRFLKGHPRFLKGPIFKRTSKNLSKIMQQIGNFPELVCREILNDHSQKGFSNRG